MLVSEGITHKMLKSILFTSDATVTNGTEERLPPSHRSPPASTTTTATANGRPQK
jgi:hypothetical protein